MTEHLGESKNLGTSKNFERHNYVRLTQYKMTNDAFIYRMAMLTLCLTSLLGISAITCLAIQELDVPQAITALTSASMGALITLFKGR